MIIKPVIFEVRGKKWSAIVELKYNHYKLKVSENVHLNDRSFCGSSCIHNASKINLTSDRI